MNCGIVWLDQPDLGQKENARIKVLDIESSGESAALLVPSTIEQGGLKIARDVRPFRGFTIQAEM